MSLVTGIVCQYKGEKCVLLTGDKALSYGARILERPKIRRVNGYKIVIGESGDSSDLQRFYLNFESHLNSFFAELEEGGKEYKNRLTDVMDITLIQSRTLWKELPRFEIDGAILIGVTDTKTTKLYHIHDNGRRALELSDFSCIGSGAKFVGTLMLESIYNPQSPPTLDEAIRCAAAINILTSRLTTAVSSNFDCFALCKDKIGKLTETSKGQLVKDANFIVNGWLSLLRRIFFLPIKKTLDFVVEVKVDKFLRDFEKVEEKRKKNIALIIDDSYSSQKNVYNLIEKILKEEKLTSTLFKSRSEFKKGFKAIKNNVRIVLLDRRIEHRVTTDILKVINETELTIPIVLLSRGLKEQDIDSFLQRGISFHISKEEIENEPRKAQELISGILKEGDYLWEWS